jgi:hypothetical protein
MTSSLDVLEEFISSFTHFDAAEEYLFFGTDVNGRVSTHSFAQHFTCRFCDRDKVRVHQEKWSENSAFPCNKRRTISCSSLTAHQDGPNHKEKRSTLFRDLQAIQRVLKRYVRLISQYAEVMDANQIAHLEWRRHIQATLFRYLVAPVQSLPINDRTERDLLEQALMPLRSYEYWNHSAILACAVWKAQCLLQMPEDGGLLASQDWVKRGWRTCQSEHRSSTAMSTIVSAVRPFLDPLAAGCRSSYSGTGTVPDNCNGSLRLYSRPEALGELLQARSSEAKIRHSMHFRFGEYIGDMSTSRPCTLCNVSAPALHVLDARHLERELHLLDDLQQIARVLQRLVSLFTAPFHDELDILEQMTHAPWRNSVQAGLFCYLFAGSGGVGVDQELLRQTLSRWRRYEYSERLTLVGLAAWKAQCLWQIPDSCPYLEYTQWIVSGWKTYKRMHRDSNATNIIVSAVRPFLDPPRTNLVIDDPAE